MFRHIYTGPSYVHALEKSYEIYVYKNQIFNYEFDIIDIYSKSKCFSFFALLAKIRYKYCKFDISYELGKVTALPY